MVLLGRDGYRRCRTLEMPNATQGGLWRVPEVKLNHIRRWRVAFALLAVLATVFAMARPAAAHTGTSDPFGSGSSFSDIKFGNEGTDIGDAWLQRVQNSDGTETLNI